MMYEDFKRYPLTHSNCFRVFITTAAGFTDVCIVSQADCMAARPDATIIIHLLRQSDSIKQK